MDKSTVHPNQIMFSINDYDRTGYCVDKGIFLHFGNTRVKAAENIEDFKTIIECFNNMIYEIENEW